MAGCPFEKDGKEYFSDMIINHNTYVAIVDNKIVGYLASTIGNQTSYIKVSRAEIDNMFIEEKSRKLGIGKMLINKFKKECVNRKIKSIVVTASSKNIKAIKFYQKNGFEDYNTTLQIKI